MRYGADLTNLRTEIGLSTNNIFTIFNEIKLIYPYHYIVFRVLFEVFDKFLFLYLKYICYANWLWGHSVQLILEKSMVTKYRIILLYCIQDSDWFPFIFHINIELNMPVNKYLTSLNRLLRSSRNWGLKLLTRKEMLPNFLRFMSIEISFKFCLL